MSFYRGRPVQNKQNLDNSCWAACVDSFSRAMAGIPTYKEPDLIASYGIGDKGGLNLTNLRKLGTKLAEHSVKLEENITQETMSPQWLEERLRASYLILMYQTAVGSTDWHAILVYGVDNWLIYMDPRKGTYEKIPIYTMISQLGFYAFWKPKT